MKKILMYSTGELLANNLTGGMKRFIELYKYLIKENYDIDLCCADSKEKLKNYGIISKYQLIQKKSKNFFIPSGLLMFLKNIKTLIKIRNYKYEKVIVFDIAQSFYLVLLKVKNINLLLRQDFIGYRKIMIKGSIKSTFLQRIYLKIIILCERYTLKNVNKIILQCEYDRKELIKRHPKLKDKIIKMSYIQINNVNTEWIIKKSKKNLNTQEHKKNSGDFTLGFIGNFSDSRKGHDLYLKVLEKIILENKVKIKALIIGGGKEEESYRKKYKKYENIIFLGRVDNPIQYIKICDLVVVPSKADSCPNVVLEALYNNVAVIASNRGGIPEILKEENCMFELNLEKLEKKIKFYLEEKNIFELKYLQLKIKKDLEFNWGKKIINIILTDN